MSRYFIEELSTTQSQKFCYKYLGGDFHVKDQLLNRESQTSFFGASGGITYANMMSIKQDLESAKVEGINFTTSPK